jgi:hypothetical protein
LLLGERAAAGGSKITQIVQVPVVDVHRSVEVRKKELHTFESLYKFIQRTCTVF